MGSKIKIARLRVGKIKAYEFAKEVGISKQYLSNLETGKVKNPSRELMLKMSKALNTSIEELFFSEEK